MTSVAKFNEICELAKNFSKRPTDSEFLEFYGLFKQATVGDCTVAKPGLTDLTGKAKWEAWNSHKGLTQEAARDAYVKVYEKFAPKYA